MNIYKLEQRRTNLIRSLHNSTSIREEILHISDFIDLVIDSNDQNVIDAYLPEFIKKFVSILLLYEVYGIGPESSQKLLHTIDGLICMDLPYQNVSQLKDLRKSISTRLNILLKCLNGELAGNEFSGGITFPALEKITDGDFAGSGFLECIDVHIRKAKKEQKFVIVPTGKEIEIRLNKQVVDSWTVALGLAKKYTRRQVGSFEVVIEFDRRYGFYEGNSLGVLLTILFLEEILRFYNAPIIVIPKESVSLTGGLDANGQMLALSEEITRCKVEVAFYSTSKTLLLPKVNEPAAIKKLNELQFKFPKRNLDIVAVENVHDLLNRRNLVDLRKLHPVIRSAKIARKHWLSLSLLLIIIGMIYFANLWDFDDNPAILVNEESWLFVQNKNGKELWRHKMAFDYRNELMGGQSLLSEKIVDINLDGTNEVILAFEDRTQFKPIKEAGRIVCYSSDRSEIWEYYFRDTIRSQEMTHSNYFLSFIIDTVSYNDSRSLLCFASNDLYPCALFFLDLRTGKRIGPTLWHTGHLSSGLVGDFDIDGESELVCEGINNAFGRRIIFSIDIANIEGQAPTEGPRKFRELKFAKFNEYLLLPKSDYTEYFNLPWNFMIRGNLSYSKKIESFLSYLLEGKPDNLKGIQLKLDKNLNVTLIDPSLEFEVARDTLVRRGELFPPYTHTTEYIQFLYSQLRYWDGEKFVALEYYEK